MSAGELAFKSGVSYDAIRKLESQRPPMPLLSTWVALVRAMGFEPAAEVAYLVGEEPPEEGLEATAGEERELTAQDLNTITQRALRQFAVVELPAQPAPPVDPQEPRVVTGEEDW